MTSLFTSQWFLSGDVIPTNSKIKRRICIRSFVMVRSCQRKGVREYRSVGVSQSLRAPTSWLFIASSTIILDLETILFDISFRFFDRFNSSTFTCVSLLHLNLKLQRAELNYTSIKSCKLSILESRPVNARLNCDLSCESTLIMFRRVSGCLIFIDTLPMFFDDAIVFFKLTTLSLLTDHSLMFIVISNEFF